MCSLCAHASPKMLRCSQCKQRTYCGKECQKMDWKLDGAAGHVGKGHKKYCKALRRGDKISDGDAAHELWCAYKFRHPEIHQGNLIGMGVIARCAHPGQVITTGLNTCIFIVVATTKNIIAWHAASTNMPGQAQEDVTQNVRLCLEQVDKKGHEFVRGYIIPGVDRKKDLDLKPDCRTMIAHPWTDPTASNRFIKGVLTQFKWSTKLEVLPPPNHYKDFVVFDSGHLKPFTFSDTALFDSGCEFDAAVDGI